MAPAYDPETGEMTTTFLLEQRARDRSAARQREEDMASYYSEYYNTPSREIRPLFNMHADRFALSALLASGDGWDLLVLAEGDTLAGAVLADWIDEHAEFPKLTAALRYCREHAKQPYRDGQYADGVGTASGGYRTRVRWQWSSQGSSGRRHYAIPAELWDQAPQLARGGWAEFRGWLDAMLFLGDLLEADATSR